MKNEEIRVVLASENDWQEYKKIRLLAITSEDKKMLGYNLRKEIKRTEEDWRKLARGNKFIALSFYKNQLIGFGMAKKDLNNGCWILYSGYILKEFQGQGVGRKMLEFRIAEIKKRNGKKVRLGLSKQNTINLHLTQSLGFRKLNKWRQLKIIFLTNLVSVFFYNIMELDL
jgi:ribosomal protein S18 acetylase RimI-like enzyme